MGIIHWSVADYFAAEGGLYVHSRNAGTYLLWFGRWDNRGPPFSGLRLLVIYTRFLF